MTPQQLREKQDQFFKQCRNSCQTLDEILQDLNLPTTTLAGWLMDKAFRERMHGMRRDLRRQRELQVDIGASRAAAALTRTVDGVDPRATAVRRAACVDLIRLARDSKARNRASNPTADEHAALYHPRIAPDEAQELMEQLARARAASREDAEGPVDESTAPMDDASQDE